MGDTHADAAYPTHANRNTNRNEHSDKHGHSDGYRHSDIDAEQPRRRPAALPQ